MRINKLFSNYGICSRSETNRLIEEGRVKVNGKSAVLGQWVEESDTILLDGFTVKKSEKLYFAFNKPVGIVCTNSKDVNNNIIDYINYNKYIFPVGRLDKDSEGLIIMTNDGEYSNKLINSDEMHEKEYIVTLDKSINEDFIKNMESGVYIKNKKSSGIHRISDTKGIKKIVDNSGNAYYEEELIKNIAKNKRQDKIKSRPCKCYIINEHTFGIILTQGLNRQIRKMCSALGYEVVNLKRIRIANINLGNLMCGELKILDKKIIEEFLWECDKQKSIASLEEER